MNNSRHITNKTQSALAFGHSLIKKINDTPIYAEKMYSPNFTVDNKIFCLSLHYNSDNSYLFVNGKEVTKFKAKNFVLIKYPMCLGVFQKIIIKIVVKIQDYMETFMTLVLGIVPPQMMKY